MEVVEIAWKLVKLVKKRAEEAKSNIADCKHLAELTGKTEVVLRCIGLEPPNDPAVLNALQTICEALESVDEAIKDCCETTVIGALLRSQKHHDDLKAAALKIGDALSLIPLALVGQSSTNKEDLESLISDLRNIQFKQSLDSMTRMAELQRQLEVNFNRSREDMTQHSQQIREGQEVITQMMKPLQQQIGEDKEAQSDLKILRKDLAAAQANKESREKFQLEQIIHVLEMMEDKGTQPNMEMADEPPSSILCPISKEVMRDPVLVIESEMTYERSSIEEWFALGHSTDPLTKMKLSSKQFVRNMAVRIEAHAYLESKGLPVTIIQTASTIEIKFDPDTFGGHNDNPAEKERHVSSYQLSVRGHDWNRVNCVKTTRALLQKEWIGTERVNGDQIGIGVSINKHRDGGIRFNGNSLGIYLDAQMAHWGHPEEPTREGWNRGFSGRLVRDPQGLDGMWICIDYEENKLWYRHPFMEPIDFDLPARFRHTPLYGHYQVWNDKTLRFALGTALHL